MLNDARAAGTHENIKPRHPAQTGGACSTCHSAANVELLALKSGERATLDQNVAFSDRAAGHQLRHAAQLAAQTGGRAAAPA